MSWGIWSHLCQNHYFPRSSMKGQTGTLLKASSIACSGLAVVNTLGQPHLPPPDVILEASPRQCETCREKSAIVLSHGFGRQDTSFYAINSLHPFVAYFILHLHLRNWKWGLWQGLDLVNFLLGVGLSWLTLLGSIHAFEKKSGRLKLERPCVFRWGHFREQFIADR